jgi:molecular chaperone HtpG
MKRSLWRAAAGRRLIDRGDATGFCGGRRGGAGIVFVRRHDRLIAGVFPVDYRFQVNLGGIINLLANNLYSGPKVFLRELLQNSVDAIHAREQLDKTFKGEGDHFDRSHRRGGRLACFSRRDADLRGQRHRLERRRSHKFLATIGESSKRGELGEARADFIGQFGIGLLSCFMVAEEIVVITRSARDRATAVEWRGRPDGTYSVKKIDSAGEPGTRVYLRASSAGKELFAPKMVKELAEKYGSLLPHPITVTSGKRSDRINATAPWEEKFASLQEGRQTLLEYGKEVFNVDFLDVIPLESETGDVSGVAFVLPYSPSPSAKGRHRVYLKRMLLSEAGEGILPEWAFFVRCVINANGLRPTAAREGFYEDDALAAARQSLGECLRSYLLDLGATNPKRLQKVIQIHYLAIKALAVYDEEFYKTFIDFIPFETSLGTMSMKELREQAGRRRRRAAANREAAVGRRSSSTCRRWMSFGRWRGWRRRRISVSSTRATRTTKSCSCGCRRYSKTCASKRSARRRWRSRLLI